MLTVIVLITINIISIAGVFFWDEYIKREQHERSEH